jgi:hypothetical protein
MGLSDPAPVQVHPSLTNAQLSNGDNLTVSTRNAPGLCQRCQGVPSLVPECHVWATYTRGHSG